MQHSQYFSNHDSIISDSGKIVLALASPSYYNKVASRITKVNAAPTNLLHIHNAASSNISSESSVDSKEIVKRSKCKRETVRRTDGNGNGNGNDSGKIVLALASPYYFEVGTGITRVKATPTDSLHIDKTTGSNISSKSSVVDANEIVKRSKCKREPVSRVGENQLQNDVVTKGIRKKNIRQCDEVESRVARVSPYFFKDARVSPYFFKDARVSPYFFKDELRGNTNSSMTGNVDTNSVCQRKNNVQDNWLPHEHENRNGCQEESNIGVNNVSTTTKEEKNKVKKNKKEKKRKNPLPIACHSVVSLEGDTFPLGSRKQSCLHESQGCSQVSIVRKVSPFFQSKTQDKDDAFVISSVSSEHQSAAGRGVCTTEIDVEDGNDKNNIKDEYLSIGKTQKPHPYSRNLKRKKVKDKEDHDLSPDFGQEDSDMMIHKMSTKTKKSKDSVAYFTKCSQLKGQEHELDACSAGSRKEVNPCETQDCVQGFTIKKVSPYFQPKLLSKEPDDKINNSEVEFLTNRPCRKTLMNLEEVLSKYTYKCERMVRRDQANDSGGKKKRKKKLGARSTRLSAADKLAEPYKRKNPCNTWKPPRSPHNLLQEDHVHDPWRVLVICMLLNVTTGSQVKEVLSDVFRLCPNAEAAVSADANEIERVIQSLGLQSKRADTIKRFSTEYLSDDWTHVTQLHGIGKYAADAYAIFCNGMWRQVTPNDHKLNDYWKFLINRDFKPI